MSSFCTRLRVPPLARWTVREPSALTLARLHKRIRLAEKRSSRPVLRECGQRFGGLGEYVTGVGLFQDRDDTKTLIPFFENLEKNLLVNITVLFVEPPFRLVTEPLLSPSGIVAQYGPDYSIGPLEEYYRGNRI